LCEDDPQKRKSNADKVRERERAVPKGLVFPQRPLAVVVLDGRGQAQEFVAHRLVLRDGDEALRSAK
jgi:hypothetical protein